MQVLDDRRYQENRAETRIVFRDLGDEKLSLRNRSEGIIYCVQIRENCPAHRVENEFHPLPRF